MMLSKKNSETLENFSEKLEVEGRSLWQDARRRFMHNRAAVASLVVLVIIALFVTLAPMLSQFTYFDTDWGMMSSAPDMESGHYFGTDSSGRDLLVRVAIGGRISLMVGIAAALVAVVVGTLYGSLSGYLGGKIDSVMMRLSPPGRSASMPDRAHNRSSCLPYSGSLTVTYRSRGVPEAHRWSADRRAGDWLAGSPLRAGWRPRWLRFR